MNILAQRVKKAFDESPTVTHKFIVTVQLAELDARNDQDNDPDIQDIVELELGQILGTRGITVERL